MSFGFEVDGHRRDCLLNGWDDIGLVLRQADRIRAFEARRLADQPWLGKSLAP
jgi:3-isopropylmalate/(R)-2-methylmalate dehydratase small subunit